MIISKCYSFITLYTFIIYHTYITFIYPITTRKAHTDTPTHGSHTGGSSPHSSLCWHPSLSIFSSFWEADVPVCSRRSCSLWMLLCLLELDSREKVKDCRVGVTNNISKCLVERFAVIIGTVEVRLYSISLVPGFRWEAGSPSNQSNDPCLLVVAKKRDISRVSGMLSTMALKASGTSLVGTIAMTRCWNVR